MNWAEPIAYGALNLTPREFENLQPHEFYKLLKGYIWRKHGKENLFAYFTLQIINTCGNLKEPLKMKDILDPLYPERQKAEKQNNAEQIRKIYNKLQDRS